MLVAIIVMILPSVVNKPENGEILIYNQTIAAVKNVPVFHVDEITIYQSPHYPQTFHEVSIFLGKDSCNHVPYKTVQETTQQPLITSSLPPNKTLYLLKGSEMTFNICAVTNDSTHRSGAYVDLSIEEGLMYLSNNQRNPRNQFHHALSFGYTADLSNQTEPTSEWNCSNMLKFTVSKNGYYSIIIIGPRLIDPANILLWYNFTAVYKIIKPRNNLPAYCIDNSHFYKESDPCKIKIRSTKHTLIWQHQCIIIEVHGKLDSDDFSNFGNIVIEYSNWQSGQSAFVGTGGFVLGVGVFVLVLLVCLYCNPRRNQRPHSSTAQT